MLRSWMTDVCLRQNLHLMFGMAGLLGGRTSHPPPACASPAAKNAHPRLLRARSSLACRLPLASRGSPRLPQAANIRISRCPCATWRPMLSARQARAARRPASHPTCQLAAKHVLRIRWRRLRAARPPAATRSSRASRCAPPALPQTGQPSRKPHAARLAILSVRSPCAAGHDPTNICSATPAKPRDAARGSARRRDTPRAAGPPA